MPQAAILAGLSALTLLFWFIGAQPLLQARTSISTTGLNAILILTFSIQILALTYFSHRRLIWQIENWQNRGERLWASWSSLEFAAAPMLLAIKDREGRYTRINQAYASALDCDESAILGKTNAELFTATAVESLSSQDQIALASGRISCSEDSVKINDVNFVFFTIRIPLLDHHGKAQALISIAIDTAPFHQVEEGLRENEKLLRLIFEQAPIAIGVLDLDGNIFNANPYCCDLFGYQRDEFRLMNLQQLFSNGDKEQLLKLQNKLKSGDIESFAAEGQYHKKDGTNLFGYQRMALVRDEHNAPKLLLGLLEDITQRKADEQALREREEYLRLTFDNAPIGIAIVDLNNQLIDVNASQCKQLGYARDEMIGHSLEEFISTTDWPSTKTTLTKMRAGQITHYERTARYRCKNGDVTIAATQGGIIHDRDGNALMLVIQMQDISRQIAAEAEGRDLRQYLQNIIDSMPSMLVGVDADTKITQWNATAASQTGVSASGAIGLQVVDVLPMLSAHIEHIQAAINTQRPHRSERLAVEVGDENHFIDIIIYPLTTKSSPGAVIRVDDVSDRVRLEEMMVQTEKMLSVGGLAAGMAHEINNPLGAILQGAQNLRRRLSPELKKNREQAEALGINFEDMQRYLETRQIFEFVNHIHEAGSRAAKIVTDMLAFSRRSILHFETVEPGELLDASLRLATSDYDLKQSYDFKRIQIHRDYSEGLRLSCDKNEIQQVILNLLRNAAQAMTSEANTDKTQKIFLRTRREGNFVRIDIADNGPGMTEDVRKRVFEPFFTTKEVGVGTGLGLSVSYFIVSEQHHGTLSVKSTPGHGCCFSLRLPIQQENS